MDETHNPFLGDEALFAKKEAEMQQKMKRRDGSNMTLAQSKRANELQKDMNALEVNMMLTSGFVRMREVSKSSTQHLCLLTCSRGAQCFLLLHIVVSLQYQQPAVRLDCLVCQQLLYSTCCTSPSRMTNALPCLQMFK